MRIIILLLIAASTVACRKEERPIPAKEIGDLIINGAEMNNDYRYQLYFNLEENEFVGKNLKTDWDIAFTTGSSDFRIKLNAANAMSAANFGAVDFFSITDTAGFAAKEVFDAISGNLDSTAIGDWRNKDELYIINRGFSYTGQHRGYAKMKIISSDANSYTIKLADINESSGETYSIKKQSSYNFSFFSLDEMQQVQIEPPKANWDLAFTQYVHIFYELQPLPYLVTGTLLNSYETKATLVEDVEFEAIDIQFAMEQELSENVNEIGYDWKSFIDGNYIIHSEKIYIIQDQNSFFYKLRFIDFYDENGQRGKPTWEYMAL